MNNKNTLYFPFILITIALLLAGCGGKPAQPTSAPIPATVAATDIPVPVLLPTATDIPIPILLPTPTDIPVPTFSATATSPSTLAVVNVESLGILSGPGTAYGIQAYVLRGDELTILGQTNNCAWLKVSTTDGETGWVAETYVTYSLACSEIALAPIPALPTAAPQAQATQAGSGSGSASCTANDTIYITNASSQGLYVTLSGPATYSLLMAANSNTTLSVCAGSYTWTANGCGGTGTGSGSVNSGGSLDLNCYQQ